MSVALASILSLAVASVAISPPVVKEVESSYLLVQVERPARYVGLSKACDQDVEDGSSGEVICLTELQDAKVVVLRHLAGPKVPYRVLVRSMGHHQYVYWQRGTRLLVKTVPFSDKGVTGQFASYWDSEKHRKFCVEADEAAAFGNTPLGRLYARGTRKRVNQDGPFWSKGTDIICVQGDEKLAN